MRGKKWITWILPQSQAFLGDFPLEVGYRFCTCLDIRFTWHLIWGWKSVWLGRTPLLSMFSVFSSPKWKFNVWRKCQSLLYCSRGTTCFCFREHWCLGYTSPRKVAPGGAGKPQDSCKDGFYLSPPICRAQWFWLRPLLSQCSVWGKQSAHLIQRGKDGGVGGTLSSRYKNDDGNGASKYLAFLLLIFQEKARQRLEGKVGFWNFCWINAANIADKVEY